MSKEIQGAKIYGIVAVISYSGMNTGMRQVRPIANHDRMIDI